MAHKSDKTEEQITKSFVFKTKETKEQINGLWKPAIEEYVNYYNKVSEWIASNLLSMKIGDLAQYIKVKDSNPPKYYEFATSEEMKDLPLYEGFKLKGGVGMCFDNAIYAALTSLNVENYHGNSLGLSETYFRRGGYVAAILGNFRTKMTTLSTGIKSRSIEVEEPSDDLLMSQTIFEIETYGIKNEDEWKRIIEYLENQTNPNKRYLNRMNTLFAFYKEHKEEVYGTMQKMSVLKLAEFMGCQRTNALTMTIAQQNAPITKHGKSSFLLSLRINRNPYVVTLLGNRQVVKVNEKGERLDLIDICEKHGVNITFKIKNEELHVILTTSVDFKKTVREVKKVVGVDINTKHMMLSSSIIDDNRLKGYVNLYKEFLKDKDFTDTLTKEEVSIYEEMSKNANFGILECDTLFERVKEQWKCTQANSDYLKRERAMEKVFGELTKKYKDTDVHIVNYINYTKMLRAKCKAYYILKEKYFEKQQEFDKTQDYNDQSTETKELMDKKRWESPFVQTDTAQGLLKKLDSVLQDIIGCRNNIIRYAFNVFRINDYDTIALEYLTTSNFKSMITTPTINSLLKYHHLESKSKDEVEQYFKNNRIKGKYYCLEYDENNLLKGVSYTQDYLTLRARIHFNEIIIKAIHFADIKDKFMQLANNNDMNIGVVPFEFTSQMDSKTHSLYFVEDIDKKGKKTEKLLDKRRVRSTQEKHINGLNADYNAACNIQYIIMNETMRNTMTKVFKPSSKTKHLYNYPAFNIQDKYKGNLSANTLNTIKKIGNYKVGVYKNGEFFEIKSVVNNKN